MLISAVLVALYVQKSDGNTSLETVALLALAATSILAIWSPIVAIGLRGRPHIHRFAWYFRHPRLSIVGALLGIVGLLVSMTAIDSEDTDFDVQPSKGGVDFMPNDSDPIASLTDTMHPAANATSPGERVHDSDSIAVRNIMFLRNGETIRLTATVLNKTKTTVIADQALISLTTLKRVEGDCLPVVAKYRIDDTVVVRDGELQNAEVDVHGGIHDGFTIPVTGRLETGCEPHFQLAFRIASTLGPLQSTDLVVDVPAHLHAIIEEGSPLLRPTSETGTLGGQHKIGINFEIPKDSDPFYLRVAMGVGHTSSDNNWACAAQNFGYTDLGVNKEPCRSRKGSGPR